MHGAMKKEHRALHDCFISINNNNNNNNINNNNIIITIINVTNHVSCSSQAMSIVSDLL